MKLLSIEEEKEYLNEAKKEAIKSTCLKSKCGSIIVKNKEIIGRGFNSPPNNLTSQQRCLTNKEDYHDKVTDKTCCIHAEQRAIIDALKTNPEKVKGSSLYFIRLDKDDNVIKAGKPYCTICSKLALDIGIKDFVLWHEEGVCAYGSEEYNDLSFQYDG